MAGTPLPGIGGADSAIGLTAEVGSDQFADGELA
jgi:hypothetical protein